jgi:hypothetical protein
VGRTARAGSADIPAYSPQAPGRSECNFGPWQGRLPQDGGCADSALWKPATNRDNAASVQNLWLQIEKVGWRGTLIP